MKKLCVNALITTALLGTVAITPTFADDQKMESTESRKIDEFSQTAELSATVKDIDYKSRKITLEDQGKTVSFNVGNDVKNFDQIKKNDKVNIEYREALAFTLHKGGEAKQAMESNEEMQAKPGEAPGGTASRSVTATVKITEVDKKAPSVTFKTAKGETQTVKLKDASRLEGVNVGDTVEIAYSEAMAVKIEKQAKM